MQNTKNQRYKYCTHVTNMCLGIIFGTEMCQEFRHVSVSLVLAVRGSGLPFLEENNNYIKTYKTVKNK